MSVESVESARQWYSQNRDTYARLSEIVRGTIESLLTNAKVDYLSVTQRPKSLESFAEKIERKGYTDPRSEVTDLAGIRIITFIEADVKRVCDVIRRSFHVDEDRSLDKAQELDVDRFGYRSIHFVCDLGESRAALPEFSLYRGLLFEIQVRTVLQHAWAEIEHDRNYKLAGVLPSELRRRLHSIAGVLEIADREFNTLAAEVDAYAKQVAANAKAGNLDVAVNSTSLREYLKAKLSDTPISPRQGAVLPQVIRELHDYGIISLADLDTIISKQLIALVAKYNATPTDVGFLRVAMMLDDVDKYMHDSWKGDFNSLIPSTRQLLREKYGEEKVAAIANQMSKAKLARSKRSLTAGVSVKR